MNAKKFAIGLDSRFIAGLFALLVLVYLGFSLLVAPSAAALKTYHLSVAGARAITISFVVPLVLIWTAGLFGSLKLRQYSRVVKGSPESRGLAVLSYGLLILVVTQPFASDLTSLVAQIVKHSPQTLPTLTIINNYIQILLMAAALTVIARGAAHLGALARRRSNESLERQLWALGLIAVSIFYGYFLVSHRLQGPGPSRQYFMPDWLALLTIAIPYLFFWYKGLYASFCIFKYQRNVRGLIYRHSLLYIAGGIVAVIISSIFVRFLATIADRLTRLSITPVLIIIYVFLGITGLGYILIAWGARKMRRIEEV